MVSIVSSVSSVESVSSVYVAVFCLFCDMQHIAVQYFFVIWVVKYSTGMLGRDFEQKISSIGHSSP